MNDQSATKDCPFCRTNGLLKGEVIATSAQAYLIENSVLPGNYLIIPEVHTEQLTDLPDTWWADVKELLVQVPNLPADYNISFNIGRFAGQTVKHVHLWVVPRFADQPAAGKGLVTLIDQSNQR